MLRQINKILEKFDYKIIQSSKIIYDVAITSFPKSGRTWLRMLLGKIITQHVGLKHEVNTDSLLNLPQLADLFDNIPKIGYGHENSGVSKPKQLNRTKKYYVDIKIIMLVRDPRDIVVSQFFSEKKRMKKKFFGKKPYKGTISEFIYEKRGSFDTIIEFYNIWAEKRNVPKDFLLVRYEDMHNNIHGEIKRILNFIGMHDVEKQIIDNAIEFAGFDNMRKMEENKATKSIALRPININDKESYKTRKGKVGDYKNHFTEKEIEYLTNKMNKTLSPFFGYDTNL